ncbi:hypothetical protein MCOR25_006413 [Pyricularia grisea]|uniref:Structural maintenance of chromosomes protein n=1 Tax=Pyricularia grisea TaxID=148305 RepID=A0A6P8B6N0_PYRGI|nr:hypothetical protein PgNI_05971 [Pyricularia grisea]KAI6361668.1 hypothetical protein MCOR25_006413 [Pyricularia grisea]TLD10976.1 hypothetical protein PgNI_05971 [Pyricularia grisea]
MGKLLRLELFNFKSYKGHHTLLFGDSYFTSIIGPNGSGKSNSMDAISFVLGIKSSHLRSTHLKDLVYRGRVMKTSKINEDGSAAAPDTNGHTNGAHNGDDESQPATRTDPKTAWVMAVYEDEAGDEQRWKRSITSQGASEYRINERVVTSQAYNEALEAENILIKARNFLVFQGDVEAIANQSPQDLTRLIEQISGSLEHKPEYEKLKADLEQAAENQAFMLNRRRGINSEIRQYQEQKREAEAFQKKTEERDEAVVTQILWKLYHYQRIMDKSNEKINEHQENLKEFRRNVEAYQRELEAAQREQAVVGRQVGKVERAIKEKEKAVEDEESLLIPVETKIRETSQNVEARKRQLDSITKTRDEYAENVQRYKKELAKVEKAQQRFEAQWKEKLKNQGKELSDEDRKEYDDLRRQADIKSAENKSKLDVLTRQLKNDEATLAILARKTEQARTTVDKLNTEIEMLQRSVTDLQETERARTAEIEEKKKAFNNAQSERTRINQMRTQTEEKLREVLKRLEEADAGQRQTAKERNMKETISNLKRLYPGVKGRVGDLCRPKQKKFTDAVVIALGHDFDTIVVETNKVVDECLDYLKKQRLPRMNFIPLDNIKASTPFAALKGKAGVRLVIDTIDFDPSVERAMAYACGSSIVCDTFDIAKSICYDEKIAVKAVTLDGKLIHKGGLMTGGRLPDNKGNKRRFEDVDVQQLKDKASEYRSELEQLYQRDMQLRDRDGIREELAALERSVRGDRQELQALKKNLQSKQRELEHAEAQLADWENKAQEKSGEVDTARKAVERFRKAIADVEDKIFADFCKRLGYSDIRAYEEQRGNLEAQAASERSKFGDQQSKLSTTLKFEESRLANTEQRLQAIQREVNRLEANIEIYSQEEATIQDNIETLNTELAQLRENLEGLKEEHKEKVVKAQEARSEVQKRTKDIDARQKAIDALETEVQKNSAQKFSLLRRCKLERIQVPLKEGSLDDLPDEDEILNQDPDAMDVDDEDDGAMEAAMNDHGIAIDYDNLPEDLRDSDEDGIEEQLERKISELNAELEKLNPNMRAVERLETVETRLKQTDTEFQDAKVAYKNAHEAFEKIKNLRFEKFDKAFKHIQEQISSVYKELTRSDAYPLGGQAYLDIEEDTDTPYLSGIKYHAMPPLKRFRDMEHLSGGEKTMAAMALLFAIHSFQPSPFFVLDEVDAALDNANVDKIKKYIREHAGPGMQFIVISLKPGLFQDSESLVGVYRDQDVNSSRTMTLDLRPYQ